jgi:hypothetical protein
MALEDDRSIFMEDRCNPRRALDFCRPLCHGGDLQVHRHEQHGKLHRCCWIPGFIAARMVRRIARKCAGPVPLDGSLLLRGLPRRSGLRPVPRLCFSWAGALGWQPSGIRLLRRPFHLHCGTAVCRRPRAGPHSGASPRRTRQNLKGTTEGLPPSTSDGMGARRGVASPNPQASCCCQHFGAD